MCYGLAMKPLFSPLVRGLAAAAVSLLVACSGDDPPPSETPVPDLAVAPALHALTAKVTFMDDGMGVPFFTQNGSRVHVPSADIIGKKVFYATVAGGKSIANAKPIEAGQAVVGADLSATITTGMLYPDGFFELAVFVSVTGGDLAKGPQPGDLAAFDLSKPPAGEPPVTGVSVRFHIKGGDTAINLGNLHFIRF